MSKFDSQSEVDNQFREAILEIGRINPWWSEADHQFIFEHARYPEVRHADPRKIDAVRGYLRALKKFIREGLNPAGAEA